ncbi:MAG: hypothetical protein ETSY1_45405 [Candidatus Entotheonella factor]|uniref:PilZ domain-containing protein n=1 Tax=Entotheonella factor TaxID=1429438 RepID=W4L1Z6_ENTF1|nr:MAG: hypothetical protein ETSY1_45405 [Candidatus Entotheonella factor]
MNPKTQVIKLPADKQLKPPVKEAKPPQITIDIPSEPCQRSRERRQYPRKLVKLRGHYWAELDDTPTGNLVITDLSLGGACFQTLSPHGFKHKDSLPLEFKLDDQDVTTILQNVQIRWIKDNYVGVQWLDRMMVHGTLRTYLSA